MDAAQDLSPINPLVYGSNYGPWLFLPLDMRPQAAAAKISFLRLYLACPLRRKCAYSENVRLASEK